MGDYKRDYEKLNRVMVAMLEYHTNIVRTKPKDSLVYRQALQWFEDYNCSKKQKNYLLSFSGICEALGYDPVWLKEGIFEKRNGKKKIIRIDPNSDEISNEKIGKGNIATYIRDDVLHLDELVDDLAFDREKISEKIHSSINDAKLVLGVFLCRHIFEIDSYYQSEAVIFSITPLSPDSFIGIYCHTPTASENALLYKIRNIYIKHLKFHLGLPDRKDIKKHFNYLVGCYYIS